MIGATAPRTLRVRRQRSNRGSPLRAGNSPSAYPSTNPWLD
jgi:hypothetical protein